MFGPFYVEAPEFENGADISGQGAGTWLFHIERRRLVRVASDQGLTLAWSPDGRYFAAALERFRFSLLEAARDLGASRARAFWTITFPLVLPAVLGAVLLAAAVSIDEFIIAFFNTGSDGTLPLVIYSRIRRVIDPGLNALATILLAISSVFVAIYLRITMREEQDR